MRFMACRIDASLQERFFFTRCVRDWSGILLERSGKRYSGKPDAKRNAQIKCIVESVELIVNSSKRESLAETQRNAERICSRQFTIYN